MMTFAYLVALATLMGPASDEVAEDLRAAVRNGNVDRVKALLDSGGDPNTAYENGYTPIYFADNPKVVDLLIAHGAKLNLRDRASAQSPIENAARQYDLLPSDGDTWKVIVARLRTAGAEYTINTAIYMDDIQHIKKSLAADSFWVDSRRRGAQSFPLRLAAETGHVEICKLLLEHKADPDAFEEGNGYPIMVGAVKHPAVVKLLIEHGANLRRRITWRGGRTGRWLIGDEASALHLAVERGKLESVKLLIAAKLDPNAADDLGQTPLHIAIKLSHKNITKYLVDNDASISLRDKSGMTPLSLERVMNSSPVMDVV